jgi:hypothetical protein
VRHCSPPAKASTTAVSIVIEGTTRFLPARYGRSTYANAGGNFMTIERDKDPDATVKMPLPIPRLDNELEDVDPEKTLVREDWERLSASPQGR